MCLYGPGLSPAMLSAGERGCTWQSLAQGASVWKIWMQWEKEPGCGEGENLSAVGEGARIASQCGGDRWSTAVKMKDVLSFVLRGINDQNSSLLWCLYKAHSNQGFGLLGLTPALLTTTSWLFLSISICCLFAVRSANSLGFRQLFLLVFVHYWIPWGSGPGLMLGAVISGICTWKVRY